MKKLAVAPDRPVVIVGAGIAGLVAALELASLGVPTEVVERSDGPGGKMQGVRIGGLEFDAGPTVLTMRWVFEELFADHGLHFEHEVPTRQAQLLARHAWSEREMLDLHANVERSAESIGRLAGRREAEGFKRFCTEAAAAHRVLMPSFMTAQRPSMPGLVADIARGSVRDLFAIQPFQSLWSALGRHFRDPRLRQLFGRYATYCGSSPFDAPATLMLIAHVEQAGVWLVDGGMRALAAAIERLARARGARFRYGAEAVRIDVERGAACGVELAGSERIDAAAVIVNADVAALAGGPGGPGLLDATAAASLAAAAPSARQRSLSAVTWLVDGCLDGFRPGHHNVFFSRDYRAEFDALFGRGELPHDPTVYVCAQDRGTSDAEHDPSGRGGSERLFVLVNAPATGDHPSGPGVDLERAEHAMRATLQRCGAPLAAGAAPLLCRGPREFAARFPRTGGALYGAASHGWRASFDRPGADSGIDRLLLAGGSVHPGPGVPMAALSGRLAVRRLRQAL
ncbi:MAG TPA: phytoene desaturase family protein [Burkholderiaceae bacterium]|nr:phytoene desaturase family protein [Burkholderiaceae bacterium]